MSMVGISDAGAKFVLWPLRPDGEFVEFSLQSRPDARRGAQFAAPAQILIAGNIRVAVQDADRDRIDARCDAACPLEVGRVVPLLILVHLGEARRDRQAALV